MKRRVWISTLGAIGCWLVLLAINFSAAGNSAAAAPALLSAFNSPKSSVNDDKEKEHGKHDDHGEEDEGLVQLSKEQLAGLKIKAVKIQQGALVQTIALPGQVEWNMDRLVHITPRSIGIVAEVNITLGDRVKKGDVLCSLDSREMGEARMEFLTDRASFAVSRSDFEREQIVFDNTKKLLEILSNNPKLSEVLASTQDLKVGSNKNRLLTTYTRMRVASRNFKRTQALFEKKIASDADLVQAQGVNEIAQVDFLSTREEIRFELELGYLRAKLAFGLSRTEVENAERALHILGVTDEEIINLREGGLGRDQAISRVSLRSPLSGVVVERHVTTGELVKPGSQVYTIADASDVWMMARVYERDLRLVEVGQKAVVGLDAFPGELFEGKISYVGSQLDPNTRTTAARVVLKNDTGKLRPGMFGRTTVFIESRKVIQANTFLIPAAALQRVKDGFVVFKEHEPGKYQRISVQIIKQSREFAEVKAKLNKGDHVAVGDIFVLKSESGKAGMGEGHSH